MLSAAILTGDLSIQLLILLDKASVVSSFKAILLFSCFSFT